VFDGELTHREVPRVTGCEAASDRQCGGRYETVGLRKGSTASSVFAPPVTCTPTLGRTKRRYAQTVEQRTRWTRFAWLEPPNGLFDVDCADVRRVVRGAQGRQPPQRTDATAQQVDDDGRVQQDRSQLPDTAFVRPPLLVHPSGGIVVPLVAAVRDAAERRLDQFPAVIVVERPLHRGCDVSAATTSPDAPIQLVDETLFEGNVQTHGHNVTHEHAS
jgi:hypothetical protein